MEPLMVSAARDTMSRRASSFALAARLLPEEVRADIDLLYAMFRRLDDLVDDGAPDAAQRLSAVERWAAGVPDASTNETRLLTELDGRHDIPRGAVADFCAGMRTDLAGARFANERELDRYCYRVAGTVGVVMTSLLGSDARTSCATSMRTPPPVASTSRARRSTGSADRSRPASAPSCCATRSLAPMSCMRTGCSGCACCTAAARR
jgi:phytoene/squalene synthetase